jgi:hypothetical protein
MAFFIVLCSNAMEVDQISVEKVKELQSCQLADQYDFNQLKKTKRNN